MFKDVSQVPLELSKSILLTVPVQSEVIFITVLYDSKALSRIVPISGVPDKVISEEPFNETSILLPVIILPF